MNLTRRELLAVAATGAVTTGVSPVLTAYSGDSDRLEAGMAKVEITPPLGQPMGGFLSRLKVNGGACLSIHDPLYARVLLLQSGETVIAIVTVDLLFFSSRRVVAEAKAKWNVDHVILSSTHTHAGPIPKTGGMPQWSNLNVNPQETLEFDAFSDDPWYTATEEKIIAAIGEAMKSRFPARIGAGRGVLGSNYMPHNRRHVSPDGKVTMRWDNPQRLPTEPVDKVLRVLRVDDEAGRPRAMLAHFACHPVTLGSRNFAISADFPGAALAYMESQLGDNCMGMFLQGASGDIDPYEMNLHGEYGHQIVRNAGVSLGAKTLEVAEGVTTAASNIRVKESLLSYAQRQRPNEKLDVGITAIKIGADIALVSIPGEPFVEHQLAFARDAPVKHALLLGLAYNGSGIPFTIYLPTIQAAKEGGYGADSATFLEIGAGEQMVSEAIASMRKLSNA